MDVSEETASLHGERLTSLSYIATRLLVLGIVFHIILSMNAHSPINLKQTCALLKREVSTYSLITPQLMSGVNRIVPAIRFHYNWQTLFFWHQI